MMMNSSFFTVFPSASSSSSSSMAKQRTSLLPILPPAFSKSPTSGSSFSSVSGVTCCGGSQAKSASGDLNFMLHSALDASGVSTLHAREAREGFLSQMEKLTSIERETSISVNRRVDLAKAALNIAAEDDALVSHSSVPLPVDAFIQRMDDLIIGYCRQHHSSLNSSPAKLLESIERYMFLDKGFQRTNVNPADLRPLYLHSVLTHRAGTAAMLSLIYSEILKMLRMWTLLDFDVEIYCPSDQYSLPRAYHKHNSKVSDQPHILTVQGFFEKTLRSLKSVFWPFQHEQHKSLFLRAAGAATFMDRSRGGKESGSQLAAAKAARHRLERGVWTSVRFGDMRCALSACERLILLKTDPKELRDYSVLLYHCGFYKESLQYLNSYRESQDSLFHEGSPDAASDLEKEAEEKLMFRLNLISMEDGWSKGSNGNSYLNNTSEPW